MQSEFNSSGSTSGDRSPLSQFDFLKNVNKKQTKDGNPPKRRGPKPDSRPALTRRQELNRQAQRTHRERKEMYIKALEQEVLRLKEIFATTTRERDAVIEENRKLRELLNAHGIHYDFASSPIKFSRQNSGYGPSSSGSISGSYALGSGSETPYSPPPPVPGQQHIAPAPVKSSQPPTGQPPVQSYTQPSNDRLDYDQIGIDFVLTYDNQGRPILPAPRMPYPSPPPR